LCWFWNVMMVKRWWLPAQKFIRDLDLWSFKWHMWDCYLFFDLLLWSIFQASSQQQNGHSLCSALVTCDSKPVHQSLGDLDEITVIDTQDMVEWYWPVFSNICVYTPKLPLSWKSTVMHPTSRSWRSSSGPAMSHIGFYVASEIDEELINVDCDYFDFKCNVNMMFQLF
jgi:hypothetical protein